MQKLIFDEIVYSVELGGATIDRTRNIFGALVNNITLDIEFINTGGLKKSYGFEFVPGIPKSGKSCEIIATLRKSLLRRRMISNHIHRVTAVYERTSALRGRSAHRQADGQCNRNCAVR